MYGVITTVPAPVELYDEIYTGLARPSTAYLCTSGGQQPTASRRWKVGVKGAHDRANTDIVFPLMRELAGDQPPPSTEPARETFEVRCLTIPSGNIMI